MARTLNLRSTLSHRRSSKNRILRDNIFIPLLLAFIVVLCMIAAAVIIRYFDGRPAIFTSNSERQPGAILAVVSSISNYALTALVSAGVTLTWWRSMLQGTTLRRMHLVWEHGNGPGILSSLSAGFDSRKVVIVTGIIFIVQFISGPLLQRAVTLGTVEPRNITIRVNLPKQMPDDFMGSRLGNPGTEDLGNNGGFNEMDARRAWYQKTTMENISLDPVTGEVNQDQSEYFCPGNSTCFGEVEAPGIQTSCMNWSYTIDLLDPTSQDGTIFETNVTYNSNSNVQPYLTFTALYLTNTDLSCIGTIIVEECKIWSAVVAYPFTLKNYTWSLNLTDTELAPVIANYTTPADGLIIPQDHGVGPLIGLETIINDTFTSKALHNVPNGLSDNTYWVPLLYYRGDPNSMNDSCIDRFIRPTNDFLRAWQDIMFRVAFMGANDTYRQTITGTEVDPTTIYRYNHRFLATALTVMFIGLLSAMTLFWGFWELKRKVTLSPLEIAGAIEASIVSGARGQVNEILDEVGEVMIRSIDDRIMRIEGRGEI